jgi:hypothetical protein
LSIISSSDGCSSDGSVISISSPSLVIYVFFLGFFGDFFFFGLPVLLSITTSSELGSSLGSVISISSPSFVV